jgi:putative solute:sodium symporter small subunit
MKNSKDPRRAYWRANTVLIRNLLMVWGLVSLGFSILLVEPLNTFQFAKVPFGFWMAQQGSIYVFVVLIFIYATQMDSLDRRYKRSIAQSSELSLSSSANTPEA